MAQNSQIAFAPLGNTVVIPAAAVAPTGVQALVDARFDAQSHMIDVAKTISAIAASVAALGGGYTLADKFGWFDRAILEWSPEHFKIVAEEGKVINVTVARIKKRDDCSVESFTPSIRDAAGMVHEASTTASKFSGPAGPEIDTFTYQLTMARKEKIASGKATLLATIKYKCPEGERVVQYPRHANLSFDLKE
jgi:hypothetical protein